jgi:hypothetical protein
MLTVYVPKPKTAVSVPMAEMTVLAVTPVPAMVSPTNRLPVVAEFTVRVVPTIVPLNTLAVLVTGP